MLFLYHTHLNNIGLGVKRTRSHVDSKKWKGAVSAHENLKSFIKIFCFPHICVMPSTNLEKDRNAANEKNWLDPYLQFFLHL